MMFWALALLLEWMGIYYHTTGKRNFQTGNTILLPVEFKEFQAILGGNRGTMDGKFYCFYLEKRDTVLAKQFVYWKP